MILKQYSALPERERALFLFGYLFDQSSCLTVFSDDIRHVSLFAELIKGFQTYSEELREIVLLSLWLSADI